MLWECTTTNQFKTLNFYFKHLLMPENTSHAKIEECHQRNKSGYCYFSVRQTTEVFLNNVDDLYPDNNHNEILVIQLQCYVIASVYKTKRIVNQSINQNMM